jgi:hypothetical protein
VIADLTPTTDVPEDWVRQTRLVLWEGGGAEVELEDELPTVRAAQPALAQRPPELGQELALVLHAVYITSVIEHSA